MPLYTQVDFPSVMKSKVDIIAQNQQLFNITKKLRSVSESVISSDKYCAVYCDINNLPALRQDLEIAGIDFDAPTLLVSECALTYVEAKRYVSMSVEMNMYLVLTVASYRLV